MSRVFITGSADGLGQLSARQLIGESHEVVLHARSAARGRDAVDGAPGAAAVPYLLTALMTRPGRLVYLSSGMHRGGDPGVSDVQWRRRRWSGSQAFSDSKLYDTVLAFAVARRCPDVLPNAVEPGWVATKMGGAGAPDDLEAGGDTQAWLAVSDDAAARVSGRLFYHRAVKDAHPAASQHGVQDALLEVCRQLAGVDLGA